MTVTTLPPPAAAVSPTDVHVGRRRMTLTAVGMTLYVGGFVVAAQLNPGTPGAVLLVVIQFILYGLYLVKYRDDLILKLMLFGLALGFVELPGDAFAVRFGGLTYPEEDVALWESPLYMPFAYVPAMLQFGYLAWWAAQRWSLTKASILLALFGGVWMPIYEGVAARAGFWFYDAAAVRMIGATPYYIILAEILLAAVMPRALRELHLQSHSKAVAIGIAVGLWFDLVGPISLYATDGWRLR